MSMLTTSADETSRLPDPSAGAGVHTGSALTASDIFAMLHRRLVLIVILAVLFSALAVGGFLFWWRYYPGYTAESLIECISNVPDAGLNIEQSPLRQEQHDRFVMTQAVALKSPSILEEALRVAAVRETEWFRSIEQPAHHPLLVLDDDLKVTPMRGTNYLRVRMTARKREDPAVIVNTVVQRWHESVLRQAAQELVSERLSDSQQELRNIQSDIQTRRQRLQDLSGRLPAGAAQNPGGSVAHRQVETFQAQVAQYESELALLAPIRQHYNSSSAAEPTPDDVDAVEADPQVSNLSLIVFQLEQRRAADAQKFGPNHSAIRDIDAQIESAKETLASLRAERLREQIQKMRDRTNTSYANTQNALLQARESLAEAESELQDQTQLLFTYSAVSEELKNDLEREKALTEHINQLTRIVRQQTAVNIKIAEPATDPLEQSSPSLLVLPLGVFLAIALAMGVGLGLELMDKSVRTPQQIVRHISVAVLGVVPHTDDEEVAIDRPETALRDAPQSITAEAFRRIRTNLRFSAPPDRQKTLLITSPRVDDGKTTVASNVALACAMDGQRVLLVDTNIRRPGLQEAFDQIGERGLSNLLVGDGTLESTVIHTDVTTLDVLGAGPVSPNPVELLGSAEFRALLAEASKRYDKILLDTAPVLLTSDALVAAPVVDGVIVVVRAAANTRGAVQRACSLLTDVNAHLLGVILNAAQVTRGGYFREQLRAYYEYQTDPSQKHVKKLPK